MQFCDISYCAEKTIEGMKANGIKELIYTVIINRAGIKTVRPLQPPTLFIEFNSLTLLFHSYTRTYMFLTRKEMQFTYGL